jgi:repressor LexA
MHLTRRQREIYDFVRGFVQTEGYAPSLEEIGAHFGLSSVATVHKHIQNLAQKGLLKRAWNRSRSIEIVDPSSAESRQIPLLGVVAAGAPIEAVPTTDTISVPAELVGSRECFALRVRGDSMIDDHIMDGDTVVLESRESPAPGETVVALIQGQEVTLKRFERRGSRIRLMPANPALAPMEFPAEDVQVQGVVIGLLRRY